MIRHANGFSIHKGGRRPKGSLDSLGQPPGGCRAVQPSVTDEGQRFSRILHGVTATDSFLPRSDLDQFAQPHVRARRGTVVAVQADYLEKTSPERR